MTKLIWDANIEEIDTHSEPETDKISEFVGHQSYKMIKVHCSRDVGNASLNL